MSEPAEDDIEFITAPVRDGLLDDDDDWSVEDEAAVVADAEAAVAALRDNYLVWVREDLAAIEAAFAIARENPAARAEAIGRIAGIAHNVKGHGASFGYALMTTVGGSLSQFCRRVKEPDDAQLEVVRAHIEALEAIIVNDLTGEGGATGAELVALLRDAVAARGG